MTWLRLRQEIAEEFSALAPNMFDMLLREHAFALSRYRVSGKARGRPRTLTREQRRTLNRAAVARWWQQTKTDPAKLERQRMRKAAWQRAAYARKKAA